MQGTGIANCILEQAYPVTACHVFHVGISVQNTNSPPGRHLALPAPPSPVTPRYIHCDKFNNRWLHGLCYIIKHGSQCCMDYIGRPAIHLVCPEFKRCSPEDEGLYNYNPCGI